MRKAKGDKRTRKAPAKKGPAPKTAAQKLVISKGVRRSPRAKSAAPLSAPPISVLKPRTEPLLAPANVLAPTAAELRRSAVARVTELPRSYGQDSLVLLPRDPRWLFAYWELREETVRRARVASAMGKPMLRVYDVTDIHFTGFNAHRQVDVDVKLETTNWYINVPEGGRLYLAEVGFLAKDGRFTPMARSNTIGVPPDSLSPLLLDQFVTVRVDVPLHKLDPLLLRKVAEGHALTEEERRQILAMSGGLRLGLSETELEKAWRARVAQGGASSTR